LRFFRFFEQCLPLPFDLTEAGLAGGCSSPGSTITSSSLLSFFFVTVRPAVRRSFADKTGSALSTAEPFLSSDTALAAGSKRVHKLVNILQDEY